MSHQHFQQAELADCGPADAPVGSGMQHEQRPVVAEGRRVLIVDDDDGIRRVLRRILEQRGYQVVDSNGAQAALQVVVSDPELAAHLHFEIRPKGRAIDPLVWLRGERR